MALDDNDLALTSSDSAQVEDAVLADGSAGADAGSSPATGEKADADLLSVARDVIDKEKAKAADSPSADGAEAGSPAGAEKQEPKEVDDENFSDVPFHKHPRFKKLLQQRDEFKLDATRYRNIENFLETNHLNGEEAGEALTIAGLIKSNPVAAWERLKPTVQELLQAAGEVLPDDLRQMVDAGHMSREAAFEVSRSRAKVQTIEGQRGLEAQLAERRAAQQASEANMNAAVAWESERRTRDPNFEAKLAPLQREVAFLQLQEGRPSTPEGVKDQLNRAYKAVSAVYVAPAAAAAPKAIKPVTGGQVAGNAQPKPKSTLEIIRANRLAG